MKPRALLSGLGLLATLVAVGFVIDSGTVDQLFSKEWMDREVRGKGVQGELLYLGAAAIAITLALPRQVVSFLSGYVFGVIHGTALALAATGIGCVMSFFYGRVIGRPLVSARLGAPVERIEDFLFANPFWMTLLMRLLPVGSNFATNLVAGVSKIPAAPFFLGSFLGYLPQTLVFALAGSGVDLGAAWRIFFAVAMFVVSGAIGVTLYRNYRNGRTLGSDVDAALEETGLAQAQKNG